MIYNRQLVYVWLHVWSVIETSRSIKNVFLKYSEILEMVTVETN